MMASFSWVSLLFALYALSSIARFPGVNSIPIDGFKSSQGGEDTLGAVACESSLCSETGTEMLLMGGSAADAVSGGDFDYFYLTLLLM